MRRASTLALAGLILAGASAAQAKTGQKVDLPAGGLGQAIIALGRQAGVNIGVSDPSLAALRVKRVRGSMSVDKALSRLLEDTGADFVNLGGNSWRIVRAPARERPAVAARTPAKPVQLAYNDVPAEIIVTGSKREVRLSEYPGSVVILGMADLPVGSAGRGTSALTSRLPGLTSTHLGAGRNKLFIRGVADSSFNGPTQATVGQYLGETRLNYNAPDPDLRLYDIASIEVLQGPQGTLYGAGSLGGVLRVMPVAPQLSALQASAAGSLAATAHGDPSAEASGMINLPIVQDRLGLRAVAYAIRDGGYIDDTLRGLSDVNRTDTIGGRVSLRAEPGPGWTIDLGATFQSIDARDSQYADRNAPKLTRASPLAQGSDNDYALGQFVLRKEWNDLSFTSAVGIVDQDIAETYDATAPGSPPMLFFQRSRISLLTNENRLVRSTADGSSWILGTSFVRNRYRINRSLGPVGMAPGIAGVENGVDESTMFAEVTQSVTRGLSLTAGGRVTHARLSGSALDAPTLVFASAARMQAKRHQTDFLPSLGASYEAAEGLTLFARYQEGFRPGGIVVRDSMIQRYRNDDVASTEAGLRFGGRREQGFDAALSVAYTKWRNIQADLVDLSGLPATSNIGTGRIWTVDAALGWRPAKGLRIEAAGVFADSRLTSPAPTLYLARAGVGSAPVPAGATVIDSDALPNVAHFNGRIGADYFVALSDGFDLSASLWGRYVGRSRLGIGPVLGVTQGDYFDTALVIRLSRERYGIFLDASNLLDTTGNRFSLGSPFTLPYGPQVTPLRPRTVRIGMDVRF